MPQTWKEWAGRERGHDKYVVGDVIRGTLRHLIHHQIGGCSSNGAQKTTVPSASESMDVTKTPLDSAVTGLSSMRTGLNILSELGLPYGANALEKIRLGLEELETQLEEAMVYQQQHPESGTLLQVQVCSAAGDEDPPEWSMGKLYASTDGLLYESSDVPSWCVGPVRWSDVTSLQTLQGGDVRLEVSGGAVAYLLAGLSKLDILEKLGGLTKESPVANATKGLSKRVKRLSSKADLDAQIEQLGKRETAGAAPSPMFDSFMDQYGASADIVKAASVHSFSPTASPTSDAMNLSFAPVADELPDDAPTDMQAIVEIPMPQATIEGIRQVLSLEENWPLCSFLEEHLRITEVEETTWTKSRRIPGTLTRRLRFKMPVPADVPQAVKRLVNLPETTHVTLLARLGCSQDKVVLVQEVCTHDVTYGENFWAQDVLAFKSNPAGGVVFEKFATIRWVTALPWYAGVLGTFIEMKAKQDSKNAGVCFAKYLEREHGM